MVLAAEVDRVHVHATVVSPVVRQGDDQLHSDVSSRIDHLVEALNVDRGHAVLPKLHDNLGRARALAAVLREALGIVGGVLVVEAPGAEDLQAGLLGGGEALLDVGLVAVEGEVVGVAAGEVEVLAVKLELAVLDRDEARRAGLAGRSGTGESPAGHEAEGKKGRGLEHHIDGLASVS